jgi:hypothetical protein
VRVTSDHQFPTDLEIILRSPSGTESILAVNHPTRQDSPAIVLQNQTSGINLEQAVYGPILGNQFKDSSLEFVLSDPLDACSPLIGDYTGKVVLAYDGNCSSVNKTLNIQQSGAVVALSKILISILIFFFNFF